MTFYVVIKYAMQLLLSYTYHYTTTIILHNMQLLDMVHGLLWVIHTYYYKIALIIEHNKHYIIFLCRIKNMVIIYDLLYKMG